MGPKRITKPSTSHCHQESLDTRQAGDLQVHELFFSAVCVFDVSSAPDEDDVFVDEVHTVSKVTQDSEPAFFWFDMLA